MSNKKRNITANKCKICNKILREENKSGFCTYHYNKSKKKMWKERRTKKEDKIIMYLFIEVDEYYLNLKNQYPALYKKEIEYLTHVICGMKKNKKIKLNHFGKNGIKFSIS